MNPHSLESAMTPIETGRKSRPTTDVRSLALLGDDPAVLPLLRAASAGTRSRFGHAALSGSMASSIVAACPAVRLHDRWEGLLQDGIQAVLIAGTSDGVLEGARKLAAEGKPLLVFPHASHGTTFFYELSLIRDGNRVLLVPVFPHRALPAVSQALRDVRENKLGKIVQIQLSRDVSFPSTASPPLLSSGDVEEFLLHDADLLRCFGGRYDRVTALRTGTIGEGFSSATVALAGDHLPDASWTLRAVSEDGSGTSDRATAPAGRRSSRWTLTVVGEQGRREVRDPDSENPAAAGEASWGVPLLETFGRALDGEPASPDWSDLVRAAEVVDAARRSVARRRTIELHHETASERGQFKSHMTAIGCGVLILTLLLVFGLLLVGAVVKFPPWVMKTARVVVFIPLFAYLIAQGLILLARPPRDS